MVEWLKANGGWPALIVVGLGVLGVTSLWGGVALIAVGGVGFAVQQGRRLLSRGHPVVETTGSQPKVEVASPEHREAMRTILIGISQHVQADRADIVGEPWQEAIEAHYPELAQMLEGWNEIAKRRIEAPMRLRKRFETEIYALDLTNDFHRQTIIDGFTALTAHRAIKGQLGIKLTRQQLWDVVRVTSAPLDGVRLKASHDVAITMPVIPRSQTRTTTRWHFG